ncbi:WhiB family transcriptional regulator [Streptomyces sp. NPDC001089]
MEGYSGQVPDTLARPLDWMSAMACRDVNPDVFSEPDKAHEARLICTASCQVRTQCLARVKEIEHGMGRHMRDGVVAGLTGNERWRLDPSAYRLKADTPLLDVTTATAACGSYIALLAHLWRGEAVDPECWKAEQRRERGRVVSAGRPSKKKQRRSRDQRSAPTSTTPPLDT